MISGVDRFVRVQGSPDLTAEDLIGDIDPAKAIEHGPLSVEAFTPGKIFKANNGVLFFDELCSKSIEIFNGIEPANSFLVAAHLLRLSHLPFLYSGRKVLTVLDSLPRSVLG